jgi:hypothetical protein
MVFSTDMSPGLTPRDGVWRCYAAHRAGWSTKDGDRFRLPHPVMRVRHQYCYLSVAHICFSALLLNLFSHLRTILLLHFVRIRGQPLPSLPLALLSNNHAFRNSHLLAVGDHLTLLGAQRLLVLETRPTACYCTVVSTKRRL